MLSVSVGANLIFISQVIGNTWSGAMFDVWSETVENECVDVWYVIM